MSDIDLRARIVSALLDPGATEGVKGDRDHATWQAEAIMKIVAVEIGHLTEALREIEHAESEDIAKRIARNALATAGQNGAEMKAALLWYGEQAEAMERHSNVINEDALLAIVTTLSLDGGERARSACAGAQKTAS